MRKRLFVLGVMVGLLLALVAGTAGCGGPAASGTTLKIGISGGLTGPAAASVATVLDEWEAMLRYINEVEGGIDGIKLEWKTIDNKGVPDGAIIAYKELRDSYKPAVFLTVEDYLLAGIMDQVVQDRSTVISTSALLNRTYVPPSRVFSLAVPTADGFGGFIKHALSKGARPKIGVLHWDLQSGLSWRMAEGWARKQGVDFTAAPYAMTSMDLKPQLMSLQQASVNWIWAMANTPQAAMVVRDTRALGIVGKIPVVFMEFNEPLTLLGIAGQAVEGFLEYRAESPYSDNTESSKIYTRIMEFGGKPNKKSDNRLMVTTKAVLMAAIRQAAADVGKDKINNEAVYNALNKLTKIDTWGNMEGFGYGPDRRVGVSTIKMRQYTKDGTASAGDWITVPRVFEGKDS